ncbi:MAG: SDR family oxidoreductase [Pseudomonadales bacterium]
MKIVAVNGATGFVGTHVVKSLVERGVRPRAIVRRGAVGRDIDGLRQLGAEIAEVNFEAVDGSVIEALRGAGSLVHLIGSIAPKRGTHFDSLHQGIASRFISAAKETGLAKIVMVTALGAAPDAPSEYHRSKWHAEEALRRSGLTYVILRPSLIVGRSVGHRDSKMVRRYLELIKSKKKVPLVMGGANLVQPIFIGDLVEAVARALEQETWDNTELELAGDQVLTTRDFVGALMKTLHVQKDFVSIPRPLAWCVGLLAEQLQTVPILSRDQVRIAGINGNTKHNALVEDFGITPQRLEDVLGVYQQ